MRPITITHTTTLDDYLFAQWGNEPGMIEMWKGMINYRTRVRWANVMPAVVAALPALWEHRLGDDWRHMRVDFPYFELAQLGYVFQAVLGGTRHDVEYAVDQLFGPESAHITRPMLNTMWKRYVV